VQLVTVPEQLPNVLDRAIRIALAERAPTAVIIPSDGQEMKYSAPTQAFKTVPSSLGAQWPTTTPAGGGIRAAAALLNAGTKVALPVGSWAATSSPTISAA
jgi:pyruvate dehydrogenase (quinone)